MRRLITFVLCVLIAGSPCYAWSNKEHILLTRIAAMRLVADPQTPPAMKQWLTQVAPGLNDLDGEREYFLGARVGVFPRGVEGLAYWATVPDLEAAVNGSGERARKVEPFGVPERLLHFVDLEYFHPEEARRTYAHDLSNKPKLSDVPRDMKSWQWERAGMLPFRVEQCYAELVEAIRAGRLTDKPGQFPRDEHAAKWAGYLAHYVQDNTQPQHATIDYKSQTYFKNPRKAPNVHADVEYRLVDDEHADYPELRAELWVAFTKALGEVKDPAASKDLWEQTLEVSFYSYDALPLIGTAAAAAYTEDGDDEDTKPDFDAAAFAHFKGSVQGQEMTVLDMKARQLALAVHRVEKLWRQAWDEANTGAAVPAQ